MVLVIMQVGIAIDYFSKLSHRVCLCGFGLIDILETIAQYFYPSTFIERIHE